MPTPTIPPKDRPEWSKIVSGELKYNYKNYVLQVRTYQLQKDISLGKISQKEAIDALYDLCSKYALAVQPDFKQIFINW